MPTACVTKQEYEAISRAFEVLQADNARLRNGLAAVSLVSQRNDSPSHVLVQECGRIAREALAEKA